MSIKWICPTCRMLSILPDRYAGRPHACGRCRVVHVIGPPLRPPPPRASRPRVGPDGSTAAGVMAAIFIVVLLVVAATLPGEDGGRLTGQVWAFGLVAVVPALVPILLARRGEGSAGGWAVLAGACLMAAIAAVVVGPDLGVPPDGFRLGGMRPPSPVTIVAAAGVVGTLGCLAAAAIRWEWNRGD